MTETRVRADGTPSIPQVALIGLFVTALVTAQLTAVKILGFDLPFEIPFAGTELLLPGAALAYALTFFASDCYSELYGQRAAQVVVNVAFAMNFVVLLLVWSTIAAPVAGDSPVGAAEFETVLGPSTSIVAGSLLAYLVSQNWDVIVFHRIREYTDGEKLWLRNVASTASSQAIDTVIFVVVAFGVAPVVLGIDDPLPLGAILGLIVGQYLLKLAIAIVDTPFVYAVVSFVRSRDEGEEDPVAS